MSEQCSTQSERPIKFLLKKYQTKQPGEPNTISHLTNSSVKSYRIKKKIRYSIIIMNQLNIQGEMREQVIYLIKEFQDTNKLCKKCKCKTIITALIFYVKFSNSKKYPLSDYTITKKVKLTEEIFSKITLKIAKHFQTLCPIRHNHNV